jgi:methionine-R-sulfoxide reductase
MPNNKLSAEAKEVIENKKTEAPFSGEYNNFFDDGSYVCARCNNPLFSSEAKFRSGCGWPAFDDEYLGAVKHVPDADGMRTEIVCANCGAHLGHVFEGEQVTEKNVRFCVNSLALKFEKNTSAKERKAL